MKWKFWIFGTGEPNEGILVEVILVGPASRQVGHLRQKNVWFCSGSSVVSLVNPQRNIATRLQQKQLNSTKCDTFEASARFAWNCDIWPRGVSPLASTCLTQLQIPCNPRLLGVGSFAETCLTQLPIASNPSSNAFRCVYEFSVFLQ